MMSIGALGAAWKVARAAAAAEQKAKRKKKNGKKNGKKKKRPAGATRPILIPYEQNHHPLKN